MKKEILVFWAVSLGMALGLCAVLFPYATVPAATLSTARTPQPMETMADINLPSPFGTVSVADLVGYYIEHPPAAKSVSAGADGGAHHFGGC